MMKYDATAKENVLFYYPFLDDRTVEACIDYIETEIREKQRRVTPGLVFDAFNAVATEGISDKYPTLKKWQIRTICYKLLDLSKSLRVNCFADDEKIERMRREVTKLPASSEEVNELLLGLVGKSDVDFINTRLLQIIAYIRSEKKNLHSTKTTEGDKVVVDIEKNFITFLGSLSRQVFRSIYPLLRELISITPKVNVLGVDINELRNNVACYHESRSSDCCFYGVAEDIRESVHRRLSGDVIGTIDELIDFLKDDRGFAFISSRYCPATPEEKAAELNSNHFQDLLSAREQLKLIWNDPFRVNLSSKHAQRFVPVETLAFIEKTIGLCRQLTEPFTDEIEKRDRVQFQLKLASTLDALGDGRFNDLELGPLRKSLMLTIFDLAGTISRSSNVLLSLMTLDCVLENVSIVYYSNLVNSELKDISDANYDTAVSILVDLVSCARASGQGTRAMGVLATSLKETIESGAIRKVEAQTCIGEIDKELLRFIYRISRDIHNLLISSGQEGSQGEVERLHSNLLNDMTREKTTHLLSNLLSAFGQYLGGTGSDETRKLSRLHSKVPAHFLDRNLDLFDMVFHYGSGIEGLPDIAERDWFLGGKGASEVAMSRIVTEDPELKIGVPRGFGLGTQTWSLVKANRERQQQLREIITKEVGALEKRTNKRFGESERPLLLAARSGAIVSMPGALPTVTHIGLNEGIVEAWAKTLANPHRAYHAYIRFLFNYTEAVFFGDKIPRDALFEGTGAKRVLHLCVTELDVLRKNIRLVKKNIERAVGGFEVPDNVYDQLFDSVIGVFAAYELEEVVLHHQELKSIPKEYQTACLIQDCLPVLEDSDCSGVFLTRNPLDGGPGEIEFIHDFGEDLAGGRASPGSSEKFRLAYPEQNRRLQHIGAILEQRSASSMDIEFAVRAGEMYVIQFRPLKLAPMADVVTNYAFYKLGLMSDKELIEKTRRIVGQPLMNTFLEEVHKHNNTPIAFGQPIAGGVVSGRILHDVKRIGDFPSERIIFITKSNVPREATTKSWIDGYISEEGGVTSHASLVSIGKLPCIVGIKWSNFESTILLGDDVEIEEGEIVTLDANDGCIYRGALPILSSKENNPEYLEAEAAILELVKKREEYILAGES